MRDESNFDGLASGGSNAAPSLVGVRPGIAVTPSKGHRKQSCKDLPRRHIRMMFAFGEAKAGEIRFITLPVAEVLVEQLKVAIYVSLLEAKTT